MIITTIGTDKYIEKKPLGIALTKILSEVREKSYNVPLSFHNWRTNH
jgi:hypothetical protein